MKQTAIKYGITAGIATVLYLLIFYYTDKSLIFNPLVRSSLLLPPMIGMALASRRVRRESETGITKRQVLQVAFLSWIMAMLIIHAFLFVLFNYMDLQKEPVSAASEDPVKNAVSIGAVFFQFSFMLIPGFLLSLMISTFVKK